MRSLAMILSIIATLFIIYIIITKMMAVTLEESESAKKKDLRPQEVKVKVEEILKKQDDNMKKAIEDQTN